MVASSVWLVVAFHRSWQVYYFQLHCESMYCDLLHVNSMRWFANYCHKQIELNSISRTISQPVYCCKPMECRGRYWFLIDFPSLCTWSYRWTYSMSKCPTWKSDSWSLHDFFGRTNCLRPMSLTVRWTDMHLWPEKLFSFALNWCRIIYLIKLPRHCWSNGSIVPFSLYFLATPAISNRLNFGDQTVNPTKRWKDMWKLFRKRSINYNNLII